MRTQLTQQIPSSTAKAGSVWCALSLGKRMGSFRLSYLGSETVHQALVFTVRNPRNPEADHKAALD